jgi:uncharacterized protein (DUF934 family)
MRFIAKHDTTWHTVGGEDGPQCHPRPQSHRLLSLEQWHAVRDTWPAGLPTGLLLANTADVEALADDLQRIALVVLQFPKWTDGRAYSQARLIRARLRFRGELRAVGEVLVDMLPLLERTGFDAVQLRADQDQAHAERALSLIPAHYQGDLLQSRPLFSRVPA